MKGRDAPKPLSMRQSQQKREYSSESGYTIPTNENALGDVSQRHYYTMFVHIDSDDAELVEKYRTNFKSIQEKCTLFKSGKNICIDAGVDIFCPEELVAPSGQTTKMKSKLRCAMYFNNVGRGGEVVSLPSGYYMYPRSSTGSSTPLRLANSVGIIDAGYRGELMGCFDNISQNEYTIQKHQRLLQICSPNLTYPIFPILVDKLEALDSYLSVSNERGSGGFGSTGV